LIDNLDNYRDLPEESGIYKCKITGNSFQCNHSEDPTEWDMSIIASDFVKIELLNKEN
jgi:hypothetical protein